MDILKLAERLDKNKDKLQKAYGTLERHNKKLQKKCNEIIKLGGIVEGNTRMTYAGRDDKELYWAFGDYEDVQESIVNTERKIKDIKTMLEDIENKINYEKNKDMFIQNTAPPVIVEFLENWKRLAYSWYIRKYENYIKFKKTLEENELKARANIVNKFDAYAEYRGRTMNWGTLHNIHPRKLMEDELKKIKLDYKSIQEQLRSFGCEILRLENMRSNQEREEYLQKMLEQQKKSLLLDLLQRITSKTGEITDANNLFISDSGQINGYIIGKKGKVEVETVGAGGYNIQCFHFRTLVKEI